MRIAHCAHVRHQALGDVHSFARVSRRQRRSHQRLAVGVHLRLAMPSHVDAPRFFPHVRVWIADPPRGEYRWQIAEKGARPVGAFVGECLDARQAHRACGDSAPRRRVLQPAKEAVLLAPAHRADYAPLRGHLEYRSLTSEDNIIKHAKLGGARRAPRLSSQTV